jgi:hypothetical protein
LRLSDSPASTGLTVTVVFPAPTPQVHIASATQANISTKESH